MDYQELFVGIRDRPEMYGIDRSFGSAVSFLCGCDAGNDFHLLSGFKEWLATRMENGTNLGWPALVLLDTFPNDSNRRDASHLDEDDHIARTALFQLLLEFWRRRESVGLLGIFEAHIAWLDGQSWYREQKESTAPGVEGLHSG